MKPSPIPLRSKTTNTCLESTVRTLLLLSCPRPKYRTRLKSGVSSYWHSEEPFRGSGNLSTLIMLTSIHHYSMRKKICSKWEDEKVGCTRVSFRCTQKLQKWYTKFLYIPHSVPSLLPPSITMVHLSQLRKYWYIMSTKLHTLYSDFTSFYLMSSFCFRIPSRYHIILVGMSP